MLPMRSLVRHIDHDANRIMIQAGPRYLSAGREFVSHPKPRTFVQKSGYSWTVRCTLSVMTVYDFEVNTIDGRQVSLGDYRGKVLLVVNVASQCGFTPQYKGLQELYERNREKGFEVLGFPCNQFGRQEPGSEAEILSFCDLNYGVRFPLFSKIDVNGSAAHPLYEFLKREKPGLLGIQSIKWNFTKFLVDREGRPVRRYSPQTKPEEIESDIQAIL